MIGKNKLIYVIEIFWLLLLLALTSIVYLNQGLPNYFFNSDLLQFFNFFRDIFLNHANYMEWIFSPAPHFFPDMFLFIPFLFLTKNIYYQILISLWIMIVFTYCSMKFFYRQLFSKEKAIFFSLTVTSCMFLLAIKGFSPYLLAMSPATHVSEFIIGIFFVGIQIKIINKEKISFNSNALYVISAFLSFLCGFSDLLFIPQFALPTFLYYIFIFLKKKRYNQWVFFSSFTILPAIFGSYVEKYLVPHATLLEYLGHPSITKITFNSFSSQLSELINMLKNINHMIVFYFIIFYISIIIFFYSTFKSNFFEKKHAFLISLIFFSVILSFLSIFPLCGVNYVLDRYIMPFYFFPFLFFFLPISSIYTHKFVSSISAFLILLIFIFMLISIFKIYNMPGFELKKNYYPAEIRCIDNALEGQGRNGIAGYWTARPISMFSKKDLNVYPVLNNLNPFLLSGSLKTKSFYSFVIINMNPQDINFKIEQSFIENINGLPKKIVICGAKKVLIYSKNSMKIKKLI